MPNGNGWHRGDRVLYKPTGQRGIVEGWKDGRLLVYWGTANKTDYRDWVPDEDCVWETKPAGADLPVETSAVFTPTEFYSRQSGSNTSPT